MHRYGHVEENGYPIAAWIWGHRLRQGQHWMEYLLEFLNVLAGFDYQLGQGVSEGGKIPSEKLSYVRFARLGLRRFIFYEDGGKTKNDFDDRALDLLHEALHKEALVNHQADDDKPLSLTRDLLSAFSAVEEARSWYAKSLFPAHENLLFWQADNETSQRNPNKQFKNSKPSQIEIDYLGKRGNFDKTVTFTKRNFFARGGEIYYLLISAGTETNPLRRESIAQGIQALLKEHNQALGSLAKTINDTWAQVCGSHSDTDASQADQSMARLGWIPNPNCLFYDIVANDVETFLQAELDTLECLDLFAHLIGFHLTLYIYHRAHPHGVDAAHADGTCLEACRPMLLIDAIDSGSDSVIRRVSATLFREQQHHQVQACLNYIRVQLQRWLNDIPREDDVVLQISREVENHFSPSLRGRNRIAYERATDRLHRQYNKGELDITGFIEAYANLLLDLFSSDFRRNFLGVHRKLSKAIGFVAPRFGPSGRYVLGDDLLKILVLTNLAPNQTMTYDHFLDRLYTRYGLIVGLAEARRSGLFDRQRIDAEYYDQNKEALLVKLQHAGLATAYSDATAMIAN